jgi:hypothetical protein
MSNVETLSEGPLWIQVSEEALPWRRDLKGLWLWVKQPLIFANIFSGSYLFWWSIVSASLTLMAVGACQGATADNADSGILWFLASAVGMWALSYGLLLLAGERYFPRREAQLVLESRPDKPAGPNPMWITVYPSIGIAGLTILSWLPLQPVNAIAAVAAVWIGGALIIYGCAKYSVTPAWVTVPIAFALPVMASAWAWNAALANAAGEPVNRDAISILAPLLTLMMMGVAHWRITVIRDANVRAWQELNSLLPKLATAATAGVLDAKYGRGQLVVDLKRVNTPVELIRPVCILIGTVILFYRPWFRTVEDGEAGGQITPPTALVNLSVMDQRCALRDPWKWFLPAPALHQQ